MLVVCTEPVRKVLCERVCECTCAFTGTTFASVLMPVIVRNLYSIVCLCACMCVCACVIAIVEVGDCVYACDHFRQVWYICARMWACVCIYALWVYAGLWWHIHCFDIGQSILIFRTAGRCSPLVCISDLCPVSFVHTSWHSVRMWSYLLLGLAGHFRCSHMHYHFGSDRFQTCPRCDTKHVCCSYFGRILQGSFATISSVSHQDLFDSRTTTKYWFYRRNECLHSIDHI